MAMGLSAEGSVPWVLAVALLTLGLLSAMAYYAVDYLVETVVKVAVKRTTTTWDDDLLNDKVLKAVCRLIPPIILWRGLPALLAHAAWIDVVIRLNEVYMAIIIIVLICSVLRGLSNHLKREEGFATYPVHGVYQMVKLMVIIIGSLITLAIALGRDPLTIVAGVGASAAVLSLVFKDSILGFVAGIQLSANNMLHEGDWIVANKFDANGEVLSIGLTTVKVRNWDKTVTTIPTYSLITESFQNWSWMVDFGARRVQRSFLVDVNSVRFLTPAELQLLKDEGFLPADFKQDTRVVNLRLFRDYLERYLMESPQVNSTNPNTTTMVRQLQPTAAGLPIELYFFTDTSRWVDYEHIQADIFDHIYASVHHFALRIFQSPAGTDFKK